MLLSVLLCSNNKYLYVCVCVCDFLEYLIYKCVYGCIGCAYVIYVDIDTTILLQSIIYIRVNYYYFLLFIRQIPLPVHRRTVCIAYCVCVCVYLATTFLPHVFPAEAWILLKNLIVVHITHLHQYTCTCIYDIISFWFTHAERCNRLHIIQ